MSELNAYFRPHSMYADCREPQLQPSQEVAYLRFDNVCYNKHSLQLWVWDNGPLSSGKITIIHSSGQNYWSGTAWRESVSSFASPWNYKLVSSSTELQAFREEGWEPCKDQVMKRLILYTHSLHWWARWGSESEVMSWGSGEGRNANIEPQTIKDKSLCTKLHCRPLH